MNPNSLQDETDEKLFSKIDQSPINQAKSIFKMMTRLKQAMENNIKAIDEFNKSNSKQTREVIKLTKWLLYLTISVGIFAFLQIIVALMQNR